MLQCPDCNGFLPTGLQACPNCRTSLKPSLLRRLRRASQLVLGASVTLTLAACYGAPPPKPVPCGSSPPTGASPSPDTGTTPTTPTTPTMPTEPCPSPSASASASASSSASPAESASPAVSPSPAPAS